MFMQDYNYNLMKQTLERIQKHVKVWKNVTEMVENGEECYYDTPEEVADDMMYDIEKELMGLSFHE
jgi:hypothetical protein